MISIPPTSQKMIDMNYFAPYSPELGFRFEVEAIYNNTSPNSLYMVLASLCPSAELYVPNRTQPPGDVRLLAVNIYNSASHLMRLIGRAMCILRNLLMGYI